MTKIHRLLATLWLSFTFFIFLGFVSQTNANVDFDFESKSQNASHLHVQQENLHLTIGVLSFRPKASTKLKWQPLVDYLNQSLPKVQLSLEVYSYPEMQNAIENKTIDFLLTNSANYVQLTHRYGLSAPLASLINQSNGTPLFGFGGAIIVHKNNSSIQKLTDLKGKHIATPSFESFGGYMMQAYELQQADIKVNKDLQFLETGMPHDTAITALLNKQADAAFVRTGVLESLRKKFPLRFNQLQVINPPFELFPFMLSTRLYPEWPFAALPHTNTIMAGQIAGLLLTLEHESLTTQKIGIHGFSIPADYEPIREVLRSLRAYPYEATPKFTFQDIWTQYSLEIIGISLVVIIIMLLSINLLSTNSRLKSHQQMLEEQATSLAIAAVAFNTEQAILITTPDEKIIRVNQAFSDITGYQPSEVIGNTPRMFKSGHHSTQFYNHIWKTIQKEGFWQGEVWNRRKSGEIYPVGQSIKTITSEQGQISHYLSTFTDITLHKENENKILKLAFYDPLTQLANRRLLKDHLTQIMATSEHDNFYFAIIFIDLDNFKTLNDTLGHHYGDLLLQQLAKRLTACVR
ncbi:MAG: PhnD/SsuA/transferrin family substrate-binding protein, partial [Pseudomonadota bacterium]